MKAQSILLLVCAFALFGCDGNKTEVTEADAAKTKAEFSQESYENAMIKAGKGKELEEEKARNAAHNAAAQPEGQN